MDSEMRDFDSISAEETIFELNYADTVSALSKASIAGDLKSIRKLLSSGKLPQSPDNRGWTSIHHCVASNQIEALKLILKEKAKERRRLVNLTTWENETPLLIALRSPTPSSEMVETLLRAGANPRLSTHTRLTPLHLACLRRNNVGMVDLLIRHGADANAREDLSKSTPLHCAIVQARDAEMIDYLIRISDLRVRNAEGRTPFQEACRSNFTEAVKLFLDFDEELANEEGQVPPLACAGFLGNLEMCEILLGSGAEVNSRCRAMVSGSSSDEVVLLDVENYLPVHSSLRNLQVFDLLLKLTDPREIARSNSDFCDFSLFVLIHSESVDFYEVLLQSDLPEESKQIDLDRLISFLRGCSWKSDSEMAEKLKFVFGYNFHLEPEKVFSRLVSDLSSARETMNKTKILTGLIRMGISICPSSARILKEFAGNDSENLFGIDPSRRRISSLQQKCRIAVRSHVRSREKSDWLARRRIDQSDLPNRLKNYLLYDSRE